ncbi:MAG: S1C family serine protease [Plectolyngbya sp. WJT66-NPBG17]|jgi:S1-C subfamily serine protease|nr:S1C family serine protease [Plectolyngbya sp. WJT66-NPBG17]
MHNQPHKTHLLVPIIQGNQYSDCSGAEELGFAIPINTAQPIAQQLSTQGKVEHSYLGVQMITLTPALKTELDYKLQGKEENQGVLIVKVASGSPAQRAGFKAGHVIHKISNQPVMTVDQVQQMIEASSVGQNIALEIYRDMQSMNLTVTLQAIPTAQVRQYLCAASAHISINIRKERIWISSNLHYKPFRFGFLALLLPVV